MLAVVLQALVLASGGILSVGSITLVILLLISERGWQNGLGYMLGYTGAYTLIGASIVLLGYRAAGPVADGDGILAPVLFTTLGLILLYITQRNWRRPPSEADGETSPRLFAIVDRATPWKTFAFGALISVINFKNLAIFLSAISVIHLSTLALAEKLAGALMVTLVFCLSVIVPVGIYLLIPRRASEALNWIKRTIETRRRAIGIWVPLVFGLIFLARGISGLR